MHRIGLVAPPGKRIPLIDRNTTHEYDDGDLLVRPADLVAIARGRHLRLSRRVLFLLFELTSAPRRVRTRAELAERACEPGARRVRLQSVDQAVSRLRRTPREVLPEIEYIHTQTGVGHQFLPEKPKGKPSA